MSRVLSIDTLGEITGIDDDEDICYRYGGCAYSGTQVPEAESLVRWSGSEAPRTISESFCCMTVPATDVPE